MAAHALVIWIVPHWRPIDSKWTISRITVQVVLEGVRLWKFDAAAFQSRGNKNLLVVRVGSRNSDG